MGIRFRCHHCDYELHVKDFQAGKRGKCPECQGKFRIPVSDAANSLSIENEPESQFDNQQPTSTATESPAVQKLVDDDESTSQPNSAQTATAMTSSPLRAGSLPRPLPIALADEPGATWFVRPASGGQFGPAGSDMFYQWLVENRINGDSLIWREGWPEWLLAAEVLSDYFGTVRTPNMQAASAPLDPAANPERASTQPVNLGDRNRLIRKQRRRRNYSLMVTLLLVLTILLVGALVAVLLLQQ